jgi:hypothetical protein
MADYLKCGDTHEDMVARVKDVAECVMVFLSESVGEGETMYYPFEVVFHKQVSPNLAVKIETECFAKIREIGIEVGTTKSLDELCMDDFMCDAVFYCFGLDQELIIGPKEQCPKEALE